MISKLLLIKKNYNYNYNYIKPNYYLPIIVKNIDNKENIHNKDNNSLELFDKCMKK